ncbi:MAG: DUF1553 domain-containing protein [Verrucomicrobia bacterium]|nr:DUF1553 domain-containing protein [Verrucomicrobiota bacterium]
MIAFRFVHHLVHCLWLAIAIPAIAEQRWDQSKTKHWAFIAPDRPSLPVVKNSAWARNPIDRFVLARLEKERIDPSAEADRLTLFRRLYLDLTGLPPEAAELDALLQETGSDAYEKLVDRLLDSPHYGERWGRWWLDVARYADSNGYSIDAPRSIWRYRDWVVDAINRDLPFDQFAVSQLAGDLLPGATLEQMIATGFHRNTQINQEGGIDKEQFRIDSIFDRVATTGAAFLGLTIGCAQCHDHKFDPITQKEYYQLFAFFNNADEPDIPVATPADVAKAERIDAEVNGYVRKLPDADPALWERMVAWEQSLTPAQRQAQSEQVRTAFDVPFPNRTIENRFIALAAYVEQAPANKSHQTAIARIRRPKPKIDTTMVMRERPDGRETHLFIKGDFTRKAEKVPPGIPAVLHPFPSHESPNRLGLARWLVSPENPLLARVTVNRLWQQYFGKGLVETENDFGTQGTAPSHPDLLDWLATEFIAQSWSLKEMHRLIVTSATYRQSSRVRPELNTIDPNNRLLARQNRLRLDAEVVRDVGLAASGLLSRKLGGPPVFPPQPEGVLSLGQVKRDWKISTGEDRYRRGLYTFFFRATPHPAMAVFDAPDSFSTCTRRIRSNTPLQALTLLNDAAFYEFARALAARILREGGNSDLARLEHAFRLCVARAPTAKESQRLAELLQAEANELRQKTEETKSIKPSGDLDSVQFAAWTSVARVMLNLDETITRE